jgi:ketol-acid reductoisomerase
MRYSISDTAEYGDYLSGPRIIDAHVRETMGKVLEEVRSGAFAKRWIEENETGRRWFAAQRVKEGDQLIEKVGENLRSMMPFLDPVKVESNG